MNKDFLIYQKPPKHQILLVLILFLLIFLISLTIIIKVYNTYTTYGVINCSEECYLTLSMSYEKIEILNDNYHILIDNKKFQVKEIKYNEPYLSGNIPYEDVNIYSDELEDTSKIVKVKIKYQKQRIIKKIVNQIIERE